MGKIAVRFGVVLLFVGAVGWGWFSRSATLPVQAAGFCDQPILSDSGQLLGNEYSLDVALADLDGDDDVDAVVTNAAGSFDEVWLNDGSGQFSHLPTFWGDPLDTPNVVLGDIDNDTDVDIILGSAQPVLIYQNDGQAEFTQNQFVNGTHTAVSLTDLDSSNGPDLIIGGDNNSYAPQIYWNTGNPTNTFAPGPTFPVSATVEILAGQLFNGMPPYLVFINGNNEPSQLWQFDGIDNFVFDQEVTFAGEVTTAALAQLDGEYGLDILVGYANGGVQIWFSDNFGQLTAGAFVHGTTAVSDLTIGDVDGDLDNDILVGGSDRELLLNDGTGFFCIAQSWNGTDDTAVAFADVDGDNDLDAFVTGDGPNHVLLNGVGGSTGSDLVTTIVGEDVIPVEVTKPYTITVRNDGTDIAHDVELTIAAVAPLVTWGLPSQGSCSILTGTCSFGAIVSGGEVTVVAYQLFNLPSGMMAEEAVTVVSVTADEPDPTPGNNIATLHLLIYDCENEHDICVVGIHFCAMVGHQPNSYPLSDVNSTPPALDLVNLYHLRDEIMAQTAQGQHYIDLYYAHDAAIQTVILTEETLWDDSLNALLLWQPHLQALVNGEGDSHVITAVQVQAIDSFLDGLTAVSPPDLQQTITNERANLPPLDSFIGLTMDEARQIVLGNTQVFLPMVVKQ